MFSQIKYLLGILMSLSIVSTSFAVGSGNISNEAPSARSAGQGYVGVAGQNEDPTAVFSNPAAITALKGTQISVGAAWENIHGGYKDNSGSETKARITNAGVPNVSLTQSFMDGKLAAGLGVQSPFGLETYWPGNSPLRYVATDSRLDLVDIMPVIAYQVHPMVSVGIGADYYNVFNATLNRAVNVTAANFGLAQQGFGTFTGPSNDGSSSLTGQSTGWGYHAGVTLQPNQQHALGITYHSKIDLRVLGSLNLAGLSGTMSTIFGGSNYSTSAYTDLVIPASLQFGYAFKPNEKWTLEADTAWYDWASTQDLNVRYSETRPDRLALLNNGNPTPLSLHNSWNIAAGVNYKATDRLQVRSGFWYEPSAVSEANFNPAYLDLSRYGVALGAGYILTAHLTLDAAYSATFTHNRTINNNVGATTTGNPAYNIDGIYSDFANTVIMNLTYRF